MEQPVVKFLEADECPNKITLDTKVLTIEYLNKSCNLDTSNLTIADQKLD